MTEGVSASGGSRTVLVRMPPKEKAPAFLDGLKSRAEMSVTRLGADWVAIEPAEGAGQVRDYFDLSRLADSTTAISEATWACLAGNGPWHADVDELPHGQIKQGESWRESLLRWSESIYDADRPEAGLAWLSAQVAGSEPASVPNLLTTYAPKLLDRHPAGSFWFLRTEELLGRRFAIGRVLFALNEVPDVLEHSDADAGTVPPLLSLRAQSLTGGLSFGRVLDPLLVAFSPTALGVAFDWLPHSIVFLFGFPGSLIRRHPVTPWSLYDPHVQQSYDRSGRTWSFAAGLTSGQIESLVQWWIGRMNVVYSHLVDPTYFCDSLGRHEASRQAAWLLTCERLLADLLLIQGFVQGPELARQQAAFDLLDKAESLLGYRQDRSGRGFTRLLRRGEMVKRLDKAWDGLPLQVRGRFRTETRRAYDRLYEQVVAHAYAHRVGQRTVEVADSDGSLVPIAFEDYVPSVVRAVRNSAHGFIEVLSDPGRRDRRLLATHDGTLPSEIGDIAVLVALALIADFETVVQRRWFAV